MRGLKIQIKWGFPTNIKKGWSNKSVTRGISLTKIMYQFSSLRILKACCDFRQICAHTAQHLTHISPEYTLNPSAPTFVVTLLTMCFTF